MTTPDGPVPVPHDGTGPAHDAALEIARTRDLLGWTDETLDPSDRVLAQVLNRIEATDRPRTSAPDPAVSTGGARARRWPVMLAAAAAVVVFAFVVQGLRPSAPAMAAPPDLVYSLAEPAQASTAPSARTALGTLASAARSTPAPGQGDVMFVASYGWYAWEGLDEGSSDIAPLALRRWLRPDGSGRSEQRTGPLLLPDGTVDPEPTFETAEHGGDVFAPGDIPWDYPASLPLDPDELRQALLEGFDPAAYADPAARARLLVEQVAWLSSDYTLSAELSGALWDMLAREEAVVTLGEARDRIGRTVVALTVAAPPTGEEAAVAVLLADPATGRAVGTETVTLRSASLAVTEPTVTGFTTITDSRFVPEVGETS